MTCDLCGSHEATVHLTEIIDDESRELHLCETCAREKGTGITQPFGLADLLAGLADFTTQQEAEGKPKPKCPSCGMTYEDFRKLGKLGCGECYETFHRFLGALLKRIHGSTQHVGKAPPAPPAAPAKKTTPARKAAAPSQKLADLKAKLKQAIEAEDFEEAASLRDKIRALEAKA
ncbi:MAG: UvrB/UvrC motif-containing protein [Candidatus Omnitrophica bacterium]|nr:UvrB/UvrC motif-containing protein [Candidatus Omnitrophota bacterium]